MTEYQTVEHRTEDGQTWCSRWKVVLVSGTFICNRTEYTVSQWEDVQKLDDAIFEAASKDDRQTVDKLDQQRASIGIPATEGRFTNVHDAIAYFANTATGISDRAHNMLARLDKMLGNWEPPHN
jgi:hypothetical protein